MAILAMARDSDGATEWGGYTRARTARYAKWNGFRCLGCSEGISNDCRIMQIDVSRCVKV